MDAIELRSLQTGTGQINLQSEDGRIFVGTVTGCSLIETWFYRTLIRQSSRAPRLLWPQKCPLVGFSPDDVRWRVHFVALRYVNSLIHVFIYYFLLFNAPRLIGASEEGRRVLVLSVRWIVDGRSCEQPGRTCGFFRQAYDERHEPRRLETHSGGLLICFFQRARWRTMARRVAGSEWIKIRTEGTASFRRYLFGQTRDSASSSQWAIVLAVKAARCVRKGQLPIGTDHFHQFCPSRATIFFCLFTFLIIPKVSQNLGH